MSTPPISFVMTCYNQQDIIAEAVEAALAQTYDPLEIIVSDDCSSDDSVARIEQVFADYKGPHTVRINCNAQNLGIAGNVDAACKLATGELIVIAAGDDRSLPHRTQRLVDRWLETGKRAHLIHSAVVMLDNDGSERGIEHAPQIMRTSPKPLVVARDYLHAIGAGMAFSKECLTRFGPLSEYGLIDDHILPFRASILGEIAYVEEPLVLKRPGGVANLAIPETAHDRTFGQYLRELPWRMGDYRQFLTDIEHVEIANKAELRTVIENRLDYLHLEYAMGTASPARRIAKLPSALGCAIRTGDRNFAKRAFIYAGAPASLWALDAKRWFREKGWAA